MSHNKQKKTNDGSYSMTRNTRRRDTLIMLRKEWMRLTQRNIDHVAQRVVALNTAVTSPTNSYRTCIFGMHSIESQTDKMMVSQTSKRTYGEVKDR